MSSRNTVQKSPVKEKLVGEKTIEKSSKAECLEQGLGEEMNHDAVQGENNVVKQTPDEETATGETETQEDEQSLEEQVHDDPSLSGFDFKHLKVLQNIPISSFYGVDFDNLSLPLHPSSDVGSFYGLDTESLAAENAALDEFYAERKSKTASCGNDQSFANKCSQQRQDQFCGNKCSQDQSQIILFPESASEEDDDIRILELFLKYTLYYGLIPDVLGQPATRFGPDHPLLVYVNWKIQKAGFISGSWLTEKILKLQTKYTKLVAEKGKAPEHQEFPTPGDYSFFQLSRMIWERDGELDTLREVDVHCKDNVELEPVDIGKLVIDDQE
ncbi:hypothetical protein DCAR_0416863 [Daucus carota subsp. sativus]|uniref:Uncharacterized protein n=1 Tax=Daucus carota subsp. sativus TaxID=79200 RepID=A0A165XUT8_DAUCS|nr:hypothetical protein DCAR_0416863 [Daucus carota subsp. sativus]